MFIKSTLCTILYLFICSQTYGQHLRTYDYSLSDNYLDLLGSTVFYIGANKVFNSIESKTDLSILKVDDLWKIDRSAVYNNSLSADKWSDKVLYSSAALPFILALSQSKGNGDGSSVALMALQGILVEKGINNLVKAIVQRPRPFNYRLDGTTSRTATKSFYSGHTSGSAFFSFFTASTFSDLYPDSKMKPVVWASAIAIPAVTGLLRFKAGKHFPTDIVTGYAIGAAIGFFLPKLYKLN